MIKRIGGLKRLALFTPQVSVNFHHLFLAVRCCAELRNPRMLGKTSENTLAEFEALLCFDFPYLYEKRDDEAERRNRLLAKANDPTPWLRKMAKKLAAEIEAKR